MMPPEINAKKQDNDNANNSGPAPLLSLRAVPVYLDEPRHAQKIEGSPSAADERETWRMKDRMKTVSVALVMCLNIGVDPPDVYKPNPCARLECWIDPSGSNAPKMLEKIGQSLQKQYERWQPRARYKQSLDPTVEDIKKLCTSLRRNAKEERVLFHYNGHGVPKPTENGEIWVFNKNYTQYIPLSVYDLQSWMAYPSVYVYDCNAAGLIVQSFCKFADDHSREWQAQLDYHRAQNPNPLYENVSTDEAAVAMGFAPRPNFKECIQLAACQEHESLPTSSDLPADLFTSCLTTPIKTAILWYVHQNGFGQHFDSNIVDKIPGSLTDRRTPLGELNWIFTAVTDTIAWNTLPKDLFQKLFRQDLLVASLFRNFLLADRILRPYGCTPVSHPALPPTREHPLWQAWDYALDLCLNEVQLKKILSNDQLPPAIAIHCVQEVIHPDHTYSPFFVSQLTAFEVWLQYGYQDRAPPQQLPVVLQVLLSQVHRVRALELLSRFLDLGSWSVRLALSVGIFPYVLKLLQSSVSELRPLLSFIWAKILAVDSDCQADLIRDNGQEYFMRILKDPAVENQRKIVPAFVIAALLENNREAQDALVRGFLPVALELISDCSSSSLRLWLIIGLGRLWHNHNEARWAAYRNTAPDSLIHALSDLSTEVRAAALFALGTLLSNRTDKNDHATVNSQAICLQMVNQSGLDGSPLVRRELVVALHWLLLDFEDQFVTMVYHLQNESVETGSTTTERQKSVEHWNPRHSRSPRRSSVNVAHSQADFFMMDRSQSQLYGSHESNFLQTHLHARPSFNNLFRSLSSMTLAKSPPREEKNLVGQYMWADQIGLLESRLRTFASSANLGLFGNVYSSVWLLFLRLANDPFPAVAEKAKIVIEYIHDKVAVVRQRKEREERRLSMSPAEKRSMSDDEKDAVRPTFVVGSPGSFTTESASPLRTRRPSGKPRSPMPLSPHPKLMHDHTFNFPPNRKIFTQNPDTEPRNMPKSARVALIETEFVAWCSKRFTEPLLDSVLRPDYYEKQKTAEVSDWAEHTQMELTREANREREAIAFGHTLDTERFISHNRTQPTTLTFCMLQPYLCVADKFNLSIWDWEQASMLMNFQNSKQQTFNYMPEMERIGFVDVVNPLTHAFLLTGTAGGVVRVWDCKLAQAANCNNQRLVTAWQILGDQTRQAQQPLTCYSWEQQLGLTVAAGDTRVIRVWDVNSEQKREDLPIDRRGNDCFVTTLSSDLMGSKMICAGFTDGSVHLFDRRLPTNDSRVTTFMDLRSPVVNVHLTASDSEPGPVPRVVAGSTDGNVRVWEPRMFQEPVMACNLCKKGGKISSMSVHGRASLLAVGRTTASIPQIKLLNFGGTCVSKISCHDGMMGSRLTDASCMAFHPYRTCLAAGFLDSYVSVFGLGN